MSAGENASSSLFRHADNAVVVSVFSAVDGVLKVGFAVDMDLLHEDLGVIGVLWVALEADIGGLSD